jgi:hypothetical protein
LGIAWLEADIFPHLGDDDIDAIATTAGSDP